MSLEDNKKNAIAYYEMAFNGDPRQAVHTYVGNQYIQHNPLVANGTEGFIAYFERMASEYPNKTISFVRSVAEGDLVSLHTHQVWHTSDGATEEYVTMDFFRFDTNGKIVEHWDAIQQIPKQSANTNTMY
ncbi:nuclear transport factor 2 family protein [Stomatohabitans albus]|uniref:nuclear transport factor 2 family protein n=1 Tax=Stomatohabitans albus TaxID=3110766 RepID=UPI00300C4173